MLISITQTSLSIAASSHNTRLGTSKLPSEVQPRASTSHHRAAPHAGRSQRSETAKTDFLRQTGHPHGWPGHVVDHIVPLACGGTDAPSNMHWQTVEAAKAKDKVERQGCSQKR